MNDNIFSVNTNENFDNIFNDENAITQVNKKKEEENDDDIEELTSVKEDIDEKRILKIQIILLIVWLVLTVVIYFFGYNLFEKFIVV